MIKKLNILLEEYYTLIQTEEIANLNTEIFNKLVNFGENIDNIINE